MRPSRRPSTGRSVSGGCALRRRWRRFGRLCSPVHRLERRGAASPAKRPSRPCRPNFRSGTGCGRINGPLRLRLPAGSWINRVPGGLPEQAFWNAPVNNLVPVPDSEQTAAIGGLGDTRLNQGALIEAVPPVTPPPLGTPAYAGRSIELAQQPPPPDTGIQVRRSRRSDVGTKNARTLKETRQSARSITAGNSCARNRCCSSRGSANLTPVRPMALSKPISRPIVNGTLTQELFTARIGLCAVADSLWTDRPDCNCYANVPVGYVCNEQTVIGHFANYSGRGGTGDTNLGVSFWARKSNGCPFDPDIIITAGMTFPTAPASFVSALTTPQTSLGQGFWAATWNALVVQTFDPVTIFYGVGGRQLFGSRDVNGSTIQPGQQFTYQLGAGFAINERITLSATYFGYFITDTYDQQPAGRRLGPGTAIHAIRLHRRPAAPHHRAVRADRHDAKTRPAASSASTLPSINPPGRWRRRYDTLLRPDPGLPSLRAESPCGQDFRQPARDRPALPRVVLTRLPGLADLRPVAWSRSARARN